MASDVFLDAGAAHELPLGVTAREDRPTVRDRIVLADDNADLRGYVARLLGESGYDVVIVADGEAPLAAIRSSRPDPDHRRPLVDWEAGALVARLVPRRLRALRRRPGFRAPRRRLTRLGPEFARWWPQREVARPLTGRKHIDHPIAGRMLFEYSSLGVRDPTNLKLTFFTPLEEEGTALKQERAFEELRLETVTGIRYPECAPYSNTLSLESMGGQREMT